MQSPILPPAESTIRGQHAAPFAEYDAYDGLGLAALVRTGQLSAPELIETAIDRIERANGPLNAVVYSMFDQARAAAPKHARDSEAPFGGVPFLLKDLLTAYAGVPLTGGSRAMANYVPDYDSEVVKRYRAAGLIVLGKTNTPELGMAVDTASSFFGPARNPWDLTRSPGGSSGGSAAAVAAGMTPLASGSDGGGSIRIPAACCGLFGLKPSRGRIPTGPHYGEIWEGFATEHVLTRSVRDSAAMLDVTAGPDPGAPYYAPPPLRPFLDEVTTAPGSLRIAFTTEGLLGNGTHADCVAGVHATVRLLEGLGHQLFEDTPIIDRAAVNLAFITMLVGQTRAALDEIARNTGKPPTRTEYEPATWAFYLLGGALDVGQYLQAVETLQRTGRTVGQFFTNYDLLLTPTLSQPPVLSGALKLTGTEHLLVQAIGRLHSGRLLKLGGMLEQAAATAFEYNGFAPLFNITGQPAMSVPLHWNDEGLPIGMHFAGRYADEVTLLRLAGQLEPAQPWFARRPPLKEQ